MNVMDRKILRNNNDRNIMLVHFTHIYCTDIQKVINSNRDHGWKLYRYTVYKYVVLLVPNRLCTLAWFQVLNENCVDVLFLCEALCGKVVDCVVYVLPRFLTYTWWRALGFVNDMEKNTYLFSQNLISSVFGSGAQRLCRALGGIKPLLLVPHILW